MCCQPKQVINFGKCMHTNMEKRSYQETTKHVNSIAITMHTGGYINYIIKKST